MNSKIILIIFYFSLFPIITIAQGRSNNWLIGYNSGITPPYTVCERAKIAFPSGNSVIQQQQTRKMNFSATEANISDKQGNLLCSSNGIWVANSIGDTMINGNGLNPGPAVNASSNGYCLNMFNANLIIPFPADTNKYILFHTIANTNAGLLATELFYTLIDMTIDGGHGGVTLKNQIVFQDTLIWSIAATKHANGRDWWILMVKDNSDLIYKVFVTPHGIESVTSQSVGGVINYHGSLGQSLFSPNGKKFAYTAEYLDSMSNYNVSTRLFDFDRCSGMLSSYRFYPTSSYYSGIGLAFSANSKFLYTSTVYNIFQINADSVTSSIDTIATNDGFFSPVSPLQTDFFTMYLGNDNRIYITSGNGVIDIHYIDYPDSAGLSCGVHQHGLHLPCFNFRSIPNHPNYELGAVALNLR